MLRFLTSLSFLYAFTIGALIVYGWMYYRDFIRSRYQRRRFPIVFLLITAACFFFLWQNFHAPLQLQTFSNLDHHFIQHDGFSVAGSIELGHTDTANDRSAAYNRFIFEKKKGQVTVSAPYSEDPLYVSGDNGYRILSANFAAEGHAITLNAGNTSISFRALPAYQFELKVGGDVYTKTQTIRRGINCWNLFRDDEAFMVSAEYNNESVSSALKGIFLLRDNITRRSGGDAKFFLSAQLFQTAAHVLYDGKQVSSSSLQFTSAIPDNSTMGWGLNFLDINRNQLLVRYGGSDSFAILNRYPVSYPLTEENRNDWSSHQVSKFLVSDSKDMVQLPGVFREGFIFSVFSADRQNRFAPVLLSYNKAASNDSLNITARELTGTKKIPLIGSRLLLPAGNSGAQWIFTIRNTYNWQLGDRVFQPFQWQALIFGSLAFFFLLVFCTTLLKPMDKVSWVTQLLSCITFVLLTTRFFLYWRYKSFPPYEGMDLPSEQQLNSFGNFGIIIGATVLMALLFGFSFLQYAYVRIRRSVGRAINRPYYGGHNSELALIDTITAWVGRKIGRIRRVNAQTIFFSLWLLVLIAGAAIAALSNFDPGICRHLAIGLVILYFIFLFVCYRHSPLVAAAGQSWWQIGTGRALDIIVNNPVKILLSVSLLALFVFIDIGFAIVFLNFLLFNEAFLCVNYSIAGLSAGSRRNAALFGTLAVVYLLLFIADLLFAPYIFGYLLQLSGALYVMGYVLFAVTLSYVIVRLLISWSSRKRMLSGLATALALFMIAFLFFPKERILKKAEVTRYRIDVLTTPVDQAIEAAYRDGKTYEPVIRAAQNQWFINTFINEDNNPGVQQAGFHLLAHAPQNKGARYNAQATDLVASRFFIAEHGKLSVLLYVLLLLLPIIMLSSFYKLYPDFTNRINNNYPTVIAGFSVLNYLLITALLVILAATGRYIFFGQDLPFGSILSKQSILFPSILIVAAVLLFRNIRPEHYANRKKIIPGVAVFSLLGILLFFVHPSFNKNKEFGVADLSTKMDTYLQERLQPVMDYFDTAKASARYTLAKKDRLFTDSVRRMIGAGMLSDGNLFFANEINAYAHSAFSRHLDQRRMMYLDLYSGSPRLAVNDNYFRVQPPPHLQELWTGNVFGDSSIYNVALWNAASGEVTSKRLNSYTNEPEQALSDGLTLSFRSPEATDQYQRLYLVNSSGSVLPVRANEAAFNLRAGDSILLSNPCRLQIGAGKSERVLTCEPDAYMKNYYVNGSRYYVYPMENRFIWARNFAESISSEYTAASQLSRNAFVSFDYELMDSLSIKMRNMMEKDSAYKKGAEYGITIVDGNGRLVAMADFIKGLERPDPNDKASFNAALMGDNGIVSQSQLRKQIGNINLLRMNPGPGSTLKPIVFSAIASQLNLNWDAFASDGFSQPQHFYGGEKVAEYDFEKNNGHIASVIDYLRYSDNYYYSNVLLLGSYPKQDLQQLLASNFIKHSPGAGFHWPYFTYGNSQYWLDDFAHWPGYLNGKANFGLDSSFASVGLLSNYGIKTKTASSGFDMFATRYDSSLFMNASHKSGFILPEYALFDQQGKGIDHRIPYDLFTTSFRGHVKGSSQVMIPPVKMAEAFGALTSQSRNFHLTLNPYAKPPVFQPFYVDNSISYNSFLSLVKENVFVGMKEVLYAGTAAALGAQLDKSSPYYYYAKTGTTGDNELKSKSKLLALVISANNMTDAGSNIRKNKFYTLYFTSQNGPARQNEAFQAAIVKYLQGTGAFVKYMGEK